MLALALTWAAGGIDAIGYLTLLYIYTANMSGNSVALGIHTAQGVWVGVARRAYPVGTFFCGLVLGGAIVEAARRRGHRSALGVALAGEAVCVAAFVSLAELWLGNRGQVPPDAPWMFACLVGLAAAAMGMQNGALRRIRATAEFRTYVTGTLLNCAEALVDLLFWLTGRLRGWRKPRRLARLRAVIRSRAPFRRWRLAGSIWVAYLLGAISSTILLHVCGLAAAGVPLAIIIAVAAFDFIHPALESER
jgi:uncharacterized membrane protein YoaK (UPF0700 family)